MSTIVKPPTPLATLPPGARIFLAGSIDMGNAVAWQEQVERGLQDTNAVLLNPRRDDWDASWVQQIDNFPFRTQVEWELAAQECASLIAFYFAPGSQAPITLLELGLAARSGKAVVCCPEGYWRKGNVDVVCARYNLPQVGHLEGLIEWIRHWLTTI